MPLHDRGQRPKCVANRKFRSAQCLTASAPSALASAGLVRWHCAASGANCVSETLPSPTRAM